LGGNAIPTAFLAWAWRPSSASCSPGVELLLAKTLTSVAAKPIAATMTRTVIISGYELGLLAER